MHTELESSAYSRIEITEELLRTFFDHIFKSGSVSEFSHSKGLPYSLVYNLVHGRISSLSARDYRIIFGQDPPQEGFRRVDGTFFREMVRLWLFLNDGVKEADLYRAFYPEKVSTKVDYRIFSGRTKTVDARLEHIMEAKFRAQGFNTAMIKDWIEELEDLDDKDRVHYEEIKPLLQYLEEKLDVNPSRLLNQQFSRYESGELRTVSKKTYLRALRLKKGLEKALQSGKRFTLEKLREEIYSAREGLVLFSELEDRIALLTKYAKKSSKRYLGRAVSTYKKEKLKRIAAWRAHRIKDDWERFMRQKPEIPLRELPRRDLEFEVFPLFYTLKSRLLMLFVQEKGQLCEEMVLMPSRPATEKHKTEYSDLTSMDEAASVLKMQGRAFDLMVARHSGLFRKVAVYRGRWFLPLWYAEEIKNKEGFELVRAKYEHLASETEAKPSG
jgi:hypothetical protein